MSHYIKLNNNNKQGIVFSEYEQNEQDVIELLFTPKEVLFTNIDSYSIDGKTLHIIKGNEPEDTILITYIVDNLFWECKMTIMPYNKHILKIDQSLVEKDNKA